MLLETGKISVYYFELYSIIIYSFLLILFSQIYSTEAYVEVLDGTRVHPETYEWARKMAVDALEYDDEDANPAGALEEILEKPEKLKDLDLDAFAEELERQVR
jgi:transcriptional accessory protein Tex/SPT6